MNIFSFFNEIGNNFKNHYLQLAQQFAQTNPTTRIATPVEETAPDDAVQNDTYEPSQNIPQDSENEEQTSPVDNKDTENVNTPEVTTLPDGTYSYKRKATLDYSMKLQFDLSALTQTVEKIADGDVESFEEFATASFGLKADLKIKGSQTIKTTDTASNDAVKNKSDYRSEQVRKFAAQDKGFKVSSFHNDATKIKRSMDTFSQGRYSIAVNKFSLRYRLDDRFSFDYLNKFNTQTEQLVNSQDPNLNSYVDSAGQLAEKGSTQMMATFFNVVDEYLNNAEADLVSKAEEYFNAAAEELGFSGEIVDTAREQFVGTIKSFFNNVESAVNQLETKFVPTQVSMPTTSTDTITNNIDQTDLPTNSVGDYQAAQA